MNVSSLVLLRCADFPRVWRQRISLLLGLSLLAVSCAGHATVIGGSSSSYGVEASVTSTVLGISTTVTVGPASNSSGVAPAQYTDSDSVASLKAGLLGLLSVSTGVLQTSAHSDIDGLAGSKFADADASVMGLSITALAGLLTLSADLVTSGANVSGDYGGLAASGGVTLVNAKISGPLGSVFLDASPLPNSALNLDVLGLTGVSLILNEQILTGDGDSSRSLAVNAIHLAINGFVSGLATFTGNIVISHSEAALVQAVGDQPAQVPEPGTLSLIAVLAFVPRFRRRSAGFSE